MQKEQASDKTSTVPGGFDKDLKAAQEKTSASQTGVTPTKADQMMTDPGAT